MRKYKAAVIVGESPSPKTNHCEDHLGANNRGACLIGDYAGNLAGRRTLSEQRQRRSQPEQPDHQDSQRQ